MSGLHRPYHGAHPVAIDPKARTDRLGIGKRRSDLRPAA
jgi:hypothetical protein